MFITHRDARGAEQQINEVGGEGGDRHGGVKAATEQTELGGELQEG